MVRLKFYLVLVSLLIIGILSNSCKPKDTPTSFDSQSEREGFLKNLSENYITPELQILKSKTSNLVVAVDSLMLNSNLINLEKAQKAYDEAYSQYLKLDAIRFGAFENASISKNIFDLVGIYACVPTEVESKIASKTFNSDDFALSTRGFGTEEYLLFSHDGDNNAVLNKLKSGNVSWYLKKNTNYIDSMINNTTINWNTQKSSFSQSNSIDQGSNLSLLFASYANSLETIKNQKIQLPAGFNASALGLVQDSLIEGFYNGYSKKYLKEHVTALKNIWFGNTNSTSQLGFDDVVYAQTRDSAFVKSVKEAFDNTLVSVDNLPNQRLDVTIKNDISKVQLVYDNLVILVRLTKTEMKSKMNFSLLSSDTDGD